MKVYGVFLMAAAMASAVSAGNGKICDMDPAPAVTPAPVVQNEAPVTPATPVTEAPVAQTDAPATDAPVTQDNTTQQ
ncbi:Hypothetical protein PHPALM_16747, partial [Phytophthora palmivora]